MGLWDGGAVGRAPFSPMSGAATPVPFRPPPGGARRGRCLQVPWAGSRRPCCPPVPQLPPPAPPARPAPPPSAGSPLPAPARFTERRPGPEPVPAVPLSAVLKGQDPPGKRGPGHRRTGGPAPTLPARALCSGELRRDGRAG